MMPSGVNVEVNEGFATVAFTDPAKKGPGLAALLAVGGPESIQTVTGAPRTRYVVPEDNAKAAGLLDTPHKPRKAASGQTKTPDEAPKKSAPRHGPQRPTKAQTTETTPSTQENPDELAGDTNE